MARRPGGGSDLGRSDIGAMAALVALVALAAVITWREGALGVARNDDWSYHRALEHWVGTGQLALVDFNEQTLVGQLALARLVAPVSTSIAARQLLTVVIAVIAVIALYLLVRDLLPRRSAAVAGVCLVGGPIFGSISTSFMSDVYALAASFLCLLCGSRALRAASPRAANGWLVGSMALGAAAFSVRQVALAAPVAVLIAWAMLRRPTRHERSAAAEPGRSPWPPFVVAGLGLLLAVAAVQLFREGLPNQGLRALRPDLDPVAAARTAVESVFTLGFLVVPAALVTGPIRLARHAWEASRFRTVGVGLVVFGAAGLLLATGTRDRVVLSESYFTPAGALGEVATIAGGVEDVLPGPIWLATQAVAIAGALLLTLVLATSIARSWHHRGSGGRPSSTGLLLATYAVLVAGSVLAGSLVGRTPFDRYLLPLVPLGAVALLRSPAASETVGSRSWPARASWVGVATWVLLGLCFTGWSASYDAARWEAATRLARELGLQPTEVDGGMEWIGYHARTPYRPDLSQRNSTWYASAFADVTTCWLIVREGSPPPSVDPIPRWSISYTSFGVERHLHAHQVRSCAT